ncbi:C40 family peptidase [Nitratidesulfovibrio liaohensis]|uniref:C40 family peptidase n=1 Tax=Nitratidesulfovibrio liaohensis TaxID=2604158 RepID=A0ABY9QXK3_9BACT|nr:C40 family peptidase [Nitratidesulfovibrio liaohensis]WMW64265.1 C40 family peptidase [Nitratidesulfovibrio liaohensis]
MRPAHSADMNRRAHPDSIATAAPQRVGTRGAEHCAHRHGHAPVGQQTAKGTAHRGAARWTALAVLLLSVVALAGCAGKQQIAIPPDAQPQIRQQTPSAPSQALVHTARSALGVPYRNGGRTPTEGFDCSGFVWWTFYQHGVNLPRTTEEQAACGSPVPPGNELRPADIIVFRTGSGPLGLHTAIYTGGGQFVHSPKPGGTVREESLTVQYWQRAFLAARRILRPADQPAASQP